MGRERAVGGREDGRERKSGRGKDGMVEGDGDGDRDKQLALLYKAAS